MKITTHKVGKQRFHHIEVGEEEMTVTHEELAMLGVKIDQLFMDEKLKHQRKWK